MLATHYHFFCDFIFVSELFHKCFQGIFLNLAQTFIWTHVTGHGSGIHALIVTKDKIKRIDDILDPKISLTVASTFLQSHFQQHPSESLLHTVCYYTSLDETAARLTGKGNNCEAVIQVYFTSLEVVCNIGRLFLAFLSNLLPYGAFKFTVSHKAYGVYRCGLTNALAAYPFSWIMILKFEILHVWQLQRAPGLAARFSVFRLFPHTKDKVWLSLINILVIKMDKYLF